MKTVIEATEGLLGQPEGEHFHSVKSGSTVFLTKEGNALTYVHHNRYGERQFPVICVDTSYKWYSLYVIMPDDSIRVLNEYLIDLPPECEKYVDNCWHPTYVKALADALDYAVSDTTLDLLMGRWENEVLNG